MHSIGGAGRADPVAAAPQASRQPHFSAFFCRMFPPSRGLGHRPLAAPAKCRYHALLAAFVRDSAAAAFHLAREKSMTRFIKSQPAVLAAGIVIGLVVGLNYRGAWPSVPLHATATHGLDKFAIATGPVDNGVEALYFLDYLTGDLRAAVINPKTGKFNSFYTRNIAADFGGAGRATGYLLVTGYADMPRGANNFQFAQSIVYVADVTTGRIAAYTIPWNSTLQAAGRTQYGEFQPLDVQQFRTAYIRDE
jgi:hypothetical protein